MKTKITALLLVLKILAMTILQSSALDTLGPDHRTFIVAAGTWHSLHIQTDGSLWGHGHNSYSQTGDGTATDRSIPFQISTGVAAAAAGNAHTAYVTTDGGLWVLGGNVHGSLAMTQPITQGFPCGWLMG